MLRYLRGLIAGMREARKRVSWAFQALVSNGYNPGFHFQGICAANGVSGGLGVRITGIQDPETAISIGAVLLEQSGRNQLVYLEDDGRTLFCGDHYRSEADFQRRIESLNDQMKDWSESESEAASSEYDGFEARLLRVLRANGEWTDIALDVSNDNEGRFVTVEQLPNEAAALQVQQTLFRDIEELRFAVRFQSHGSWWVCLQEHARKGA